MVIPVIEKKHVFQAESVDLIEVDRIQVRELGAEGMEWQIQGERRSGLLANENAVASLLRFLKAREIGGSSLTFVPVSRDPLAVIREIPNSTSIHRRTQEEEYRNTSQIRELANYYTFAHQSKWSDYINLLRILPLIITGHLW